MVPSENITPSEHDGSGVATAAAAQVAASAGEAGSLAGAASRRKDILDNVYVSLLTQIVLVLIVYRTLWHEAAQSGWLPLSAYLQSSLVAAAARHAPFTVLSAIALLPLIVRHKRLRWQDIDAKKRARLFMMVPVVMFAWVCSCYDLNVAYDQAHLDARLLVVALAIGCWFHPVFVCAFALWITVVISQIQHPLIAAHWHWADKRVPYDTLFMFAAYLHVRAWARPHPQLPAFLILTLTGATYAYAAWRKMMIGATPLYWPLENNFGFLFIGAHLNGGWMRNLSQPEVLSVASLLDTVSPALGVATILCEGGALFLLWHRRSTAPILLAIIGMHVMILLSTGIFFWKWLIQNAALGAYVILLNRDAAGDGRARAHRALSLIPSRLAIPVSLVLMIAARPVFNALRFAWLDSPMTNYFEFRAHGVRGGSYRIDPRFFAPYDLLVNQSQFYYLTQRKILSGTYATTYDRHALKALEGARVEDLPAIRERYGQRHWNKNATLLFAEFVQRSVRNAQRRGTRSHPLHWLAPPYHFQTSMSKDTYAFQEPIDEVTVKLHEWFYDGTRLHHVTDEPVLRVRIAR
jgi:hypothetical protein